MTDRNGTPITIGQRVRFSVEIQDGVWHPVVGTVRAIGSNDLARCDDGRSDSDDLLTNGFRVSAWLDGGAIEVLL